MKYSKETYYRANDALLIVDQMTELNPHVTVDEIYNEVYKYFYASKPRPVMKKPETIKVITEMLDLIKQTDINKSYHAYDRLQSYLMRKELTFFDYACEC